MDLDYDIYSYLSNGICRGSLNLLLATEKVYYEIVDIDLIDLNVDKNIIRYKLNIIGANGKKLLNDDGSILTIYEDMKSLDDNYLKLSGKKNLLVKKEQDVCLVRVPKTVKLPNDKCTSKLSIFEAGKWIDVTNLDNLKLYSNKRCCEMFEFVNEEQLNKNSVKKIA